jgi:hypothetical protein
MPTPSPKPDPKKPKGPFKYKKTTVKSGPNKGVVISQAMTTAELNAEKAKAPAGTSVWRDPSVGFDAFAPVPKKKPRGIQKAPGFEIIPPKPKKGVVYPPGKIKRSQA